MTTSYARRLAHRDHQGRTVRDRRYYGGIGYGRPLAYYDATETGCWRTTEEGRNVVSALERALSSMDPATLAGLVNNRAWSGAAG